MTRVIIDTNKIFSLLLSKNIKAREFIFDESIIFYAPNFLFLEIFRLKEKIIKYTKLSEEDFRETFSILFERINFIGRNYISETNITLAFNLCNGVDEADTPFIALSLQLDAKLWTGDIKLKQGLSQKGFHNFIR